MIPDPYVSAHLHDGPHDGETVQMPWARVRIDMVRWEGSELVASVYRLAAPWRGQDTAHYRFDAPPADPPPAPAPDPAPRRWWRWWGR